MAAISWMSSFGLTKIRAEDAGGRTKITWDLCELYGAQAACGHHFVYEQTSNAFEKEVRDADRPCQEQEHKWQTCECMGLAACYERGPGFVNASLRSVTNARQVGMLFASMKVCCAMENPSASDMEYFRRIRRYHAGKLRAECTFHWQQSGELEACAGADWRSEKSTQRSVSAEVIMRSGQCLNIWPKKQRMMSLATAESELHAAAQNRLRRPGDPECGEGVGFCVWFEPTSGRRSDCVPSQPQRNMLVCRTCGYK